MKQHKQIWGPLALTLALVLPVAPALAQVPNPTPVITSPAEDAPVTSHPLTAADVETLVDGFLPYALKRGDIAGAVVTVVKDGQILLKKGYGVADRETNEPVDPDKHLFRQGSISKLFTWTAVMQQVEAGRLDLDTDVNQYLDFKIPATFAEPITIRHLMTHTAGFEEKVRDLIAFGGPPADLGTLLASHIPARIFKPGTTVAYSNYATALAGYIVQRLSGEPFADYIDRHILAPAGMTRSSMAQPLPATLVPLMAKGYESSRDPAKPFEIIKPAPAGSLSATGADMGRFMIAMLKGGEGPNGRILKPETLAQMQKPHYRPLPGQKLAMGLGFYEQNRNGYRIMGHGGDTTLFHSDLALWLDEGVGLHIAMNSSGDGASTGPMRDELIALFADRYFPARERAPAPPAETVKRAVPVGGTFQSSRRVDSTMLSLTYLFSQGDLVTNEDGTASFALFQDFAGKPKRWREIAPDRWQEVGSDSLMHTKTDASGRVTTITTDDYPAIFVFERVPASTNIGWVLPALGITLVVALFTALWWPVAALVRRHYGRPHPLSGRPLLADRLVRAASLMAVVSLGGMTAVMTMAITPLMEGSIDWLLRLLQFSALLAALGLLPAAWQAWRLWREPAGWWARIRSLLMAAIFLMVLWFIATFHLVSVSLNY
ncbi:serine hydrolase [Niveispirillum sp.]|uniref:serine hydrolase domain-containing protein n=1 Tax=Niveispirillum sp. TaxID=1917217 RepID=UPI001B5C85F9|nr:serine hydrolase domain-containing protein [Niveispirillum sp.]MBP7337478.1 beta-lactamase family protein [Niveispirillum sp.]